MGSGDARRRMAARDRSGFRHLERGAISKLARTFRLASDSRACEMVQNGCVQYLYQADLAYVHATAFETLARGAAREIVRRLRSSSVDIHKIMDVGCGADH